MSLKCLTVSSLGKFNWNVVKSQVVWDVIIIYWAFTVCELIAVDFDIPENVQFRKKVKVDLILMLGASRLKYAKEKV